MALDNKKRLRIATITYWVLLLYIIAALLWWAVSLFRQNEKIHALERAALSPASPAYTTEINGIETREKKDVYKYVGEGSAFLLLILVGAFYIYRSVRRQFRLQQQQQNFVTAVTHELKTPLAVARLNLETLQRYNLAEEKRGKLVQMTLQETLRLDTLINNVLISSQLEGTDYRLVKEELDFSHLVQDAVRDFQERYPEREVRTSVQANVDLQGDARLLKLLLSNLLENANKYSPKKAPISLVLAQTKTGVLLEVVDEGCGIPSEEKEAVFEKFYRIGSEETRKTKGTGLGLYICKKIVRDHKGEILIRDNQPTGSKFMVQFSAAT